MVQIRKKVNTHKKGQRKELLASKELEKEGYTIVFRSCTVKRGPTYVGLDFADCVDIIGVKRMHWRMVSVKHKTSGDYKITEREVDAFAEKYGLHGMAFEQWLWIAPGWHGRGKNKKWCKGEFEKKIIK